jgi:sugar/nucleoside kinase (ribokinase family)
METLGLHLNGKRVVGIGSALVDILAQASDAFIDATGVPKGGMVYFDDQGLEAVLTRVDGAPRIVPGGAACNTLVGLAQLGGEARFIGKRGNDLSGRRYEDGLRDQNVEPLLIASDSPTGRVLSLITPDSQRTMLTYLGAAAEMRPEELQCAHFADAAVVLIEGYLVFNRELFQAALATAKAAGARVVLDLASFTVVESARALLDAAVTDFIDILLANEDEAQAFTGKASSMEAVKALARRVPVAVVKTGAQGSLVAAGGKVHAFAAVRGDGIVDTTGAGDLWAAGFLFGLVEGFPLPLCGQLASACGYEVCRVLGAHIPAEGWRRIHRLLPRIASSGGNP